MGCCEYNKYATLTPWFKTYASICPGCRLPSTNRSLPWKRCTGTCRMIIRLGWLRAIPRSFLDQVPMTTKILNFTICFLLENGVPRLEASLREKLETAQQLPETQVLLNGMDPFISRPNSKSPLKIFASRLRATSSLGLEARSRPGI